MQPDALTEERIALRLPVRPQTVGLGRRAAVQFAEETGCSPETLWRVRLAVSEALANVVLHAHPSGEDEQHLVLIAECDEDGVHVTVSDNGAGLRARTDSPGMGLGLALIANSCDEMAIDAGRSGGTVVRMTFAR